MLRPTDEDARKIEKLTRINQALIQRMERMDELRGSSYALTRTAAMLEREIMARNADLERALAELSAINAELAAARETADEANRAKSRFLRAASHDLLQPLSAAKLFLSHLAEIAADPVQADLVGRITASFDSAEELIRALLDIARLDSRAFEANPGPVAVGRLFQRLAIDLQPLAAQRGIDLRFVMTAETVRSDPVLLRQIAQNLIINALKYSNGPKVLVGLRRDGDGAWLVVQDCGPGIDPADHARIFNEFERLSRADQPGSGLGLSIVARACEQLGHPVELRSAPGSGSCFRVRLPRQRQLPADPPPAPRTDRVADLAGRRILVVENDPGMRQAFGLLLRAWGMEVSDAGSVEAARRAVRRGSRPPELVLTDYRLDDGETGLQTIAALRRDLGGAVPALIVSAESSESIRRIAGPLGVPVLEKPVAETELRRVLGRLLARAGG